MKNDTHKITEPVIEFLDTMVANNYGCEQEIVNLFCLGHQLTEKFIKAYARYITPEYFTKSYKLSADIADKFYQYFDSEIYENYVILNKRKSDSNSDASSDQNENNSITVPYAMHLSMIARYINHLKEIYDSTR